MWYDIAMVTIQGKKLYRSQTDKVFTGLLGGIGEFFDLDPVLLRLGFVVLVLLSGFWPGVVVYIIGALIVPVAPGGARVHEQEKEEKSEKEGEKTE